MSGLVGASVPNALLLSVVGADLPNVPPSLSAYAALERNFSRRALGGRSPGFAL